MNSGTKSPRCLCGHDSMSLVHTYHTPPEGETSFRFTNNIEYLRFLYRCDRCGHYFSSHHMDMAGLYHGDYCDSIYRDNEGMARAFERITSLPEKKSDNAGRVKRLLGFADSHFSSNGRPSKGQSILDVGSGLCVFLNLMKKVGWRCTALDTDPRQIAHARSVVGVDAVCTDLMKTRIIGTYDVISFNKVLEHLDDPLSVLKKSRDHLKDNGFVYIELPDGEAALNKGFDREEFFIDHHHVFSFTSVAIFSKLAGFTVKEVERVREPSKKFTLRAFLIK